MAKKLTVAAAAVKKRPVLLARTARALGVSEVEADQLLRTPRRQSLRLNPLVADPVETLHAMSSLGWQGSKFDWLPEGYTAADGLQSVRDSSLVTDGKVFIQNAASWLPVLMLDAQPGELVLDVCAAPGGKTTHIAARSGNQAIITANDNSRSRLGKLQATCRRLSATIERYTLYDATQLARRLDSIQYDKILLDAPCSGEGLMRFDHDKDFETWSVAHIKRLQQLQRKLLIQAWKLLAPGGRLVYSTCTMAPEENEQVIEYALRKLEDAVIEPVALAMPNRRPAVTEWNGRLLDARLQNCLRLQPSQNIEAFFVCSLRKVTTSL